MDTPVEADEWRVAHRSSPVRDAQLDIGGFEQCGERRLRRTVQDHDVGITERATLSRGGSPEFRAIDDENRLPTALADRLPGQHFGAFEIDQRAVRLDAADAENAEIGAVGTKQRLGLRTEEIAVGQAKHAAGHEDAVRAVGGELHRGIHVVGDDGEVLVMGERLRDHLRRRADAERDGGPRRNEQRHLVADPALGLRIGDAPCVVGNVDGWIDLSGSAVTPAQEIGIAQGVDVTPDGLGRDRELLSERLHRHEAVLLNERNNLRLPRAWLHPRCHHVRSNAVLVLKMFDCSQASLS